MVVRGLASLLYFSLFLGIKVSGVDINILVMSSYQNYDSLLEHSKNHDAMSESRKLQLKKDIEVLDSLEHIEILRIIHEFMQKKLYTVSNKQTMLDLDDLSDACLWKISYYVNLCLDNQKRQLEKHNAEKLHLDALHNLDESMKRNSKLKINNHIVVGENDNDDLDSKGGIMINEALMMEDDDDISE